MVEGTHPAAFVQVRSEDGHPRTRSGTTPRVARVLVVDDEPLLAETLRLLLSDEFDVTSTTDPVEALERLQAGDRYDVVLCDVTMPWLNGVELRHRVQAFAPELAARFVFMTGGVVRDALRALVESAPNPCLQKPLDMHALRALIRESVRETDLRATAGSRA